jgi:hypothetical protein
MRDIVRVGGASGVLFFLTGLAATALVSTTGVSERDLEVGNAGRYLVGMREDAGVFVAAMWMFNVSNILLMGFAAGLYHVLRDYGPALRISLLAAVGSALLFLVETTATIGVAEGVAPFYVLSAGGERAILYTQALTLIAFRNHTALLGSIMLAAAAVGYGAAALRTGALPRWLGYTLIPVGALGLLGGLAPLSAALSLARVVGLALFALWAAAAGIAMLRSGDRPAPTQVR